MENSKGLLIILLILILVIIIAGGVLFYSLFYKLGSIEKEIDLDLRKIEKDVKDLEKEFEIENQKTSKIDEPAPAIIEEAEEETPAQPEEFTYTNSKYGFSLIFPKEWEDYVTNEKVFDDANVIYLGLPAQDNIFAISIYTHDKWDELKSLPPEQLMVSHLGQNSNYVFAWSICQDVVNEEMGKRRSQVSKITKTFVAK